MVNIKGIGLAIQTFYFYTVQFWTVRRKNLNKYNASWSYANLSVDGVTNTNCITKSEGKLDRVAPLVADTPCANSTPLQNPPIG